MEQGKSFMRGMITGAVIGASVSMMFNPAEQADRRSIKRRARKVLKTVGDTLEDMIDRDQ